MTKIKRHSTARRRSLRAAQAVAGVALAAGLGACGTGDDTGEGDAVEVTSTSETTTSEATTSEATTQTGTTESTDLGCSFVEEGVCPEGCTMDADYDCCVAQNGDSMWCQFRPPTEDRQESYCSCAVEGPIPPPSIEG